MYFTRVRYSLMFVYICVIEGGSVGKYTLCMPTCIGTNVPLPPDGPKVSLHSTLLHSGPIISAVISFKFTSLLEKSKFIVV